MAAMSFLSATPSSSFHGGGLPVGRSDPCLIPASSVSQRRSLSIRCQSTNTKEPKSSSNILDNASNLFTNLLSGGSLGSMPTAEGAVSDLMKNAEDKEKVSEMEADAETASFSNRITSAVSRLTETESLVKAFDGCAGVFHTATFVDPAGISGYSHGGVYKLAFGPKAFVVISDPIVARHVLRENAFSYDKDLLERQRVVFTVANSVASVATAWIGYSLRHYNETKIDQRLESIGNAVSVSDQRRHYQHFNIIIVYLPLIWLVSCYRKL